MSGFFGILHTDGRPVDTATVRRSAASMAFRGPDRQAFWIGEGIGLAHALLKAQIPENDERQPCSIDGRTWIVADARLDGRETLIDRLTVRADRTALRKSSDAELILRAYHRWGEAFIDRLIGDFSFALWDGSRQRLLCARDHFGVKPLYYAPISATLVFGNTLEILRRQPIVEGSIDERSMADFLLFGTIRYPDRTAFSEIRRLAPAHVLTWSAGAGLQCRRYWSLPVPKVRYYRTPREYTERFMDRMRRAVKDRLPPGRIGFAMSGGMDSTTVAAIAAGLRDDAPGLFDLHACTFFYDRWIPDDERHYSKATAERLGIAFHGVCADRNVLSFDCKSRQGWMPFPIAEPTKLTATEEMKRRAPQIRTVLTGHGGDPALLPGPLHAGRFIKSLLLGRFGADVLRYRVSRGRLPRIGLRKGLRRWFDATRAGAPDLYPPYMDRSLEERLQLRHRWDLQRRGPRPVDTLRSAAHQNLTDPFWSSLFESLDPGSTGEAVEFSHPFFDLRLISFLLALPPVPWCVDKEILRRAMRGRLPETVRQRPKTPLAAEPAYEQLKQISPAALKQVAESSGIERFVSPDRLLKLLRSPGLLRIEEYPWITRPMGLAMWLKQPEPKPIWERKEAIHEIGQERIREKTLQET